MLGWPMLDLDEAVALAQPSGTRVRLEQRSSPCGPPVPGRVSVATPRPPSAGMRGRRPRGTAVRSVRSPQEIPGRRARPVQVQSAQCSSAARSGSAAVYSARHASSHAVRTRLRLGSGTRPKNVPAKSNSGCPTRASPQSSNTRPSEPKRQFPGWKSPWTSVSGRPHAATASSRAGSSSSSASSARARSR